MKKTAIILIVFLIASCATTQKQVLSDQEIRFELIDNVPLIHCRINGKKAKLIIDTGATTSVLDLKKSEHFGYSYYADGSFAAGYGGNYELMKVSKLHIDINGVIITKGFYSKDISNINEVLGKKGIWIDGIIGSNLLRQYKVVIDYNTMTIKI